MFYSIYARICPLGSRKMDAPLNGLGVVLLLASACYLIRRGVARVKPLKSTCFPFLFHHLFGMGRAFITSNGPSLIFCLFRPLSTEFIKCHRTRENFHFLRLTLSSFVVSWTPGLIIGFSFFGTLCKRSVEWNSWFVYHSCNSTYGLLHSLPCHS